MTDFSVNINKKENIINGKVFDITKRTQESKVTLWEGNIKKQSQSINIEDNKEQAEALNLIKMLKSKDYLNDVAFDLELEKIKEMDLVKLLNIFRINNKGRGLLDCIKEQKEISKETKQKYEKYFTEELEKIYGFDKNLKKENVSTKFKSKDFKYESDKYNIIQKDENKIEIKNLTTQEVRTIDLKKIVPEGIQGINDIIELKATIQKLPPDILFEIPQEVPYIKNVNVANLFAEINGQDNVKYSGRYNIDILGKSEYIEALPNEETLVHEISHAIFYSENAKNTLKKNEKIKEAFKIAQERVYQEYATNDEFRENYDPQNFYWMKDLTEFGAEVLTAIYIKDSKSSESLKKFAPESFELIMDLFQQRRISDNKSKNIEK